jgi:taspase (threonine aspartase 1)
MSSDVVKSAPNVDISFGEMQLPRPHMHDEVDCADGTTSPIEKKIPMFPAVSGPCLSESQDQWTEPKAEEDMITDTVGAIAIDIYGRIAAGSSSGGIGMKHRGRVGPAALVGIGSAVIPIDPQDPEGLTVAAVTSGTGEHMATTIASQRCAERLYYGTKRGVRCHGEPATEEEAMHSFVEDDFMGHPGVRNSHSGGAIGVMAVKKSLHGYYLHFAHNTDSFALASMHSNEKEPKCVMSRIGQQNTSVVQGARKIRVDR